MKAFRFSLDGFVPKVQTYHLNLWLEMRNPPKTEGLSAYQKSMIQHSHQNNIPLIRKLDFEDWEIGAFVFLQSIPPDHDFRHMLNHLSERDRVCGRWFQATIDDNATVYPCFRQSLAPVATTASALLDSQGRGSPCYVPKRFLPLMWIEL